MKTAVLVLSLLAAAGTAVAQVTDADILNFALNLEYLEAEFYACATTGEGLPASLRGGGPASIGCTKANLTGTVLSIAEDIASDELAHVVFLRAALGDAAVAMPQLNIGTGATGAFSVAANAALNTTLSPAFSPYSNDITFLHGAFIFEDVGVTAYAGAAAAINNSDYLTAAAGILAVEAYHAGSIRKQLIQNSSYVVQPYGVEVNVIIEAISALRATLAGAADDQGILRDGAPNEVPTDSNGLTYTRTVSQVIAIVTAGAPNGIGLFYPEGLNGAINGSTAAASPAAAPTAAPTTTPTAATPADAPATGRKLLQAAAPTAAPSSAPAVTDVDILNFALNLEYLEAEYYSWAVNGRGIASQYRGGNGTVTGAKEATLSAPVLALAREIAADELNHVIFLRAALGDAAVPMPDLDLGTAFANAADAALNMTLSPAFSPYDSDLAFLFGAFIFEDVGVTAYKGAAALITNKEFLTAAASILSVEAYHAGAVRTLLFQDANTTAAPYGVDASAITGAISALRNLASGNPSPSIDQNVINATTMASIIAPTDVDAIAFSRTPAQVINIAVLTNTTGAGGFFPAGLNGVINGTTDSVGSVATADDAAPPATSPAPAPAPAGSSAFAAAVPSAAALAFGVASTLAMLL